MTTQRDSFLQEIRGIRADLVRLLDGMDYSFDWKPSDEEWSAREVLYHMVDTPSGGMHSAIRKILEGSIEELPIHAGLTNLTEDRRQKDLVTVREDAEEVLAGLEQVLASTTDSELEARSVLAHSLALGKVVPRPAQELVAGLFARHWKEHLGQLAELREGLGLD